MKLSVNEINALKSQEAKDLHPAKFNCESWSTS